MELLTLYKDETSVVYGQVINGKIHCHYKSELKVADLINKMVKKCKSPIEQIMIRQNYESGQWIEIK